MNEPDEKHGEEPDAQATIVLVRAAASGDQTAWRSLYARHRALLRAVLHNRIPRSMRSRFDTEDVLQSGFVAVCRELDSFEARPGGNFRNWLTQIMVNKLHDKIRYNARARRTPDREHPLTDSQSRLHGRPSAESPSRIRAAAERHAEILEALDKLPFQDQELVVLRFFDRLPWSEVAERMHVAENTARKRALEALERLFSTLLPDEAEPSGPDKSHGAGRLPR